MNYTHLLCLISVITVLGLTAHPIHAGMSSCVVGDEKIQKEMRNPPYFNSITINGAFSVQVTCGENQLVEVTADSNLLPLITTTVKDNVLNIDTDKSICAKSDPLVAISLPDMELAALEGAVNMTVTGVFNPKFTLETDGVNTIILSGRTGFFTAALKGNTDMKAQQFFADSVQIRMDNAGEAAVHATRRLDVSANGDTAVTYYGNPKTVSKKHDSGGIIVSGDVIDADVTDD